MWLPNLTQQYTQSLYTTQFLGLNRNLVTNDGEFADEINLTTDYFPVMSPRKPRKLIDKGAELGILAKDALCRVTNDNETVKLYINDTLATGATLTNTAKQLISMGAYIIIWPDKCYVNTKSTPFTIQKMEQENEISGEAFSVTMTRLNGDTYTDYEEDPDDPGTYAGVTVDDKAPESPSNGDEWIDTSSKPNTLKRWNSGTSEWVQVATTYVRITCDGIAVGLKDYDTVTVSGLDGDGINPGEAAQLKQFNTDLIVYKVIDDDSMIVVGIIERPITITGAQYDTITAHRRVPDCDFITEANNRIWGCKYGLVDDQPVNEIYACKLGDPTNWYSYMGLSTDSYAVSVGTDGVFTGAATLKGYPLFFKETCLHRIAGNFPSNYTLTTTMCRGVQKGSSRSLAVVGELLYYKARTDVMVYDGSVPQAVSDALGKEVPYGLAIGGSYGAKYYVSMCEYSLPINRKLYVLDTSKGIWHMENDPGIIGFAQLDDELYAATADGIVAMNGIIGTAESDPVTWGGVFGTFGYEYEDQKYLSRFNLRMRLEPGTVIEFYIQYDSDGEWHHCGELTGQTTDTITVPIAPRRCDHCQIRLDGTGPAKIFSIGRVLEGGSDGRAVYV